MWLPAPTICPGCTGGWRGCIADCASTGGTGSEGRSDSDGVCEVGGAGSPPSAIPISRRAALEPALVPASPAECDTHTPCAAALATRR